MMVAINNQTYKKIEELSQKIEVNTATLDEYYKYEELLLKAGTPKKSIEQNLKKANYKSWEDLISARNKVGRLREENLKASVVGGIVGLALGIALAYLFLSQFED